MLERYLGYHPKITLQVYMSDASSLILLQNSETEQSFNYMRQEKYGLNKKDTFFHNMNLP